MKIKYPKGETVWVTYYASDGSPVFLMTSPPARDFYFLYAVSPEGNITKLGKAKTPVELEEKYNTKEKCALANGKP